MKKTKIVATTGPATASYKVLKSLIAGGVNVCRLNFSHGTHAEHLQTIINVRKINEELGTCVALLGDLQGPKIRVGNIAGNGILLETGSTIQITSVPCDCTNKKIYINYPNIVVEATVGNRILMDDGKLELVVEKVSAKTLDAQIVAGGILSSHKGVNLPNTKLSIPALTQKDKEDLAFALEQNLDWIALSFVRSGRDVIELKHLISSQKKSARVISKIEKPEAIEDIDSIIDESDALMVARGDLGVELPMQNVPLLQKMIVKKCLEKSKPVIIATQMMESMIENVTPTRAEVNDVANAVMDGADAVMLSGETSIGKHPFKVIEAMSKILEQAETFKGIYNHELLPQTEHERFITDSICFNAVLLAKRVNASAIITMTHSGYTGYKISSQRPQANIFVFTGNKKILNQMSLVWGVQIFYYDKMVSTDHTIADIKYLLEKQKHIHKNDLVLNVTSTPITEKGMSNMLKLSYV